MEKGKRQTKNSGGEWREGRASPRSLPKNLAALPSEIVTTDSSDPDRAHPLDPPHVVDQYAYDRAKAEREDSDRPEVTADQLLAQMAAPLAEVVPVTQLRVDLVRWRVGLAMLDSWVAALERGEEVAIDAPYYLWFPRDNVNEYELRTGYAPRRRPRHLQHLRLAVSPLRLPRSVRDVFLTARVEPPDTNSIFAKLRQLSWAKGDKRNDD